MVKYCGCGGGGVQGSYSSAGAEFQDARYGRGMRVHVQTGGGKRGTKGARCTVCGQDNAPVPAAKKAEATEEVAGKGGRKKK